MNLQALPATVAQLSALEELTTCTVREDLEVVPALPHNIGDCQSLKRLTVTAMEHEDLIPPLPSSFGLLTSLEELTYGKLRLVKAAAKSGTTGLDVQGNGGGSDVALDAADGNGVAASTASAVREVVADGLGDGVTGSLANGLGHSDGKESK
eukprot:GHRR01021483.1.p1 GENE.GHRR01021483.1~~GHRR01021483.1.p1  ORF type:complete len:152 (+),score=58.54 GHRR01021483.1:774-1229(+)